MTTLRPSQSDDLAAAPPSSAGSAPDVDLDESSAGDAAGPGALSAAELSPPSHDAISARGYHHEGRVYRKTFSERLEAFIGRLSTRNNFWHRVCSLIWLPYAYKSGIRMVKRVDDNTFSAVLPFRRFNRNWYNAMAGASLLANSEIAGGMYIFGITGGDYTIVCKELTYKFLRPCYGPALYRIVPQQDLPALIAANSEFNITLDLDIIQQGMLPEGFKKRAKDKTSLMARLASKERRVGRCTVTFHVTPMLHNKAKRGDTRNVGQKG